MIFWHVEHFWTCFEVLYYWKQLQAVNSISASWCLFNEPVEIDELIKLANQSNYRVKGSLVIEAAWIKIVFIFENKK